MTPLFITNIFGDHEKEPTRKKKVAFPEYLIDDRRADILSAKRNVELALSVSSQAFDHKMPNVIIEDIDTRKATDNGFKTALKATYQGYSQSAVEAAQRAVDDAFRGEEYQGANT